MPPPFSGSRREPRPEHDAVVRGIAGRDAERERRRSAPARPRLNARQRPRADQREAAQEEGAAVGPGPPDPVERKLFCSSIAVSLIAATLSAINSAA